jgi:transposase
MRLDEERLIGLLLAGASIRKAADALGVDEKTIRRRLQTPAFSEKLREARGQLLEGAISALAGLTNRAVRELGRLLRSHDARIRLKAASTILLSHAKTAEVVDLKNDITELKRFVEVQYPRRARLS